MTDARDFTAHFVAVLQDEIDRRYAHELEVSYAKLERARQAPYQHTLAVDDALARLQRCQQAIAAIEGAKADITREHDRSYDALKAFSDDALMRAFGTLYP